MAKLKGILKNAFGAPIPNETIVFVALKSTQTVLNTVISTVKTDDKGAYDTSIYSGRYQINLYRDGEVQTKVGIMEIFSDSPDADINTYLTLPGEEEVTPEFIAQVIELKNQTIQASDAAVISKNEAAASATSAATDAAEATSSKTAAAASASDAKKSMDSATASATSATASAKAASDSAASARDDMELASTAQASASASATSAADSATAAASSAADAERSASSIDVSQFVKKNVAGKVSLSDLDSFTVPSGVARSLESKLSDVINARDYGLIPDSDADQTDVFTKLASVAAGKRLVINKGTYKGNFAISSDMEIVGDGINSTVIKRPNNSVSTSFITISGESSVSIKGVCVDGNKANNGTPADSMTISSDVKFIDIKSVRFKDGNSTSGLSFGTDVSKKKNSSIKIVEGCQFDGNSYYGCRLTKADQVTFSNNLCLNNGDNGLSVDNMVFPPVSLSQQEMIIQNNRFYDNTSAGCFVSGFIEGGTPAAPLYGNGKHANYRIIVDGNHVRGNKRYGLSVQANGAIISNNFCDYNGDYTVAAGPAYAGLLVNASYVTINNNICRNNSGYGMDLGGSTFFTCNNNVIMENATQAGGGYIGLNLGGCQYGTISNNTIGLNGPEAYGTQILIPGYDGGNTSFPTLTQSLTITGNTLILGYGSQRVGIRAYGRPFGLSIRNNHSTGGDKLRSICIETNEPVDVSGNTHEDAATSIASCVIDGGPAITIPDFADLVRVTGSVNVTNILTQSHNIFRGKVSETYLEAAGSGYDPLNPPAITASGGGGSGATFFAAVDGSGKIISVNVVNNGSNYTSAPTLTIAAPPSGGTQAKAVARIGVVNFEGRRFKLHFVNNSTINQINNISLPGGISSLSIPDNGVIELLGISGGKLLVSSKSF